MALLIVNSILIILLPAQIIGPLLLIEGLFLDGSGAIVALAPDVTGINKRFEQTGKIKRIEDAQNELFLNGSLTHDGGMSG